MVHPTRYKHNQFVLSMVATRSIFQTPMETESAVRMEKAIIP